MFNSHTVGGVGKDAAHVVARLDVNGGEERHRGSDLGLSTTGADLHA